MRSFRWAEHLMAMDDATWARHSNPLSGWSRLSVLPLLSLAIWSRVWIGWWALLPLALVLLWTWINPRLFGPPARTDNWMSRGVLGEKLWLAHAKDPALAHHRAVVRALSGLSGVGAMVWLIGLGLLNLPLTLAGLVTAMLSKLWLLDRMVWVHRDMTEGATQPRA